MARTEIEAPQALVHSVVKEAITPKLERMAENLGRQLVLTISVMSGSQTFLELPPVRIGKDREALSGEGRLRFRPTFDEDRFAFHFQAIFDETENSAGFTGFTVTGQIRSAPECDLKQTGYTVIYNSRKWIDWL
jgi:hypothetical protein